MPFSPLEYSLQGSLLYAYACEDLLFVYKRHRAHRKLHRCSSLAFVIKEHQRKALGKQPACGFCSFLQYERLVIAFQPLNLCWIEGMHDTADKTSKMISKKTFEKGHEHNPSVLQLQVIPPHISIAHLGEKLAHSSW